MRGKKMTSQSITLKYTGCLGGADGIYLHYGIGDTWENVTDCKMRKLKSCYKTEVTVPAGSDLKFCFRDTDGNWDNNFGQDYTYSVGGGDVTPTSFGSSVEIGPYVSKK